MDVIVVEDIYGRVIRFRLKEISKVISIFGMSLPTVAELRHQYLLRGGSLEMTPQSVKDVFRNAGDEKLLQECF